MQWFPRISNKGDVACGNIDLYLNGKVVAKGWYGPAWVDDNTIIVSAHEGPGLAIYKNSRLTVINPDFPANYRSGGFGKWVAYSAIPPFKVITSDGIVYYGLMNPEVLNETTFLALTRDSSYVVLCGLQENRIQVLYDKPSSFLRCKHGIATWYSSDSIVVYDDGKFTELYGKFNPVPVRALGKTWVLWLSNSAMYLSDLSKSYEITRGETYYPDVNFVDGRFVFAYTDSSGNLSMISKLPSELDGVNEIWTPYNEPIDVWRMFIGDSASQYPRGNSKDTGIYWDCIHVPFSDSEVALFVKHPNYDVYEVRFTYHGWFCLLEDHDEGMVIRRFEDPRICPRFVRRGQVFERITRFRDDYGEWTGPGSDKQFRFRVTVEDVSKSSLGRYRLVLAVDTYQDLEIFECYSNKGWSAWEYWRKSLAGKTVTREIHGIKVGFDKRTEWPDRIEGHRKWPSNMLSKVCDFVPYPPLVARCDYPTLVKDGFTIYAEEPSSGASFKFEAKHGKRGVITIANARGAASRTTAKEIYFNDSERPDS